MVWFIGFAIGAELLSLLRMILLPFSAVTVIILILLVFFVHSIMGGYSKERSNV